MLRITSAEIERRTERVLHQYGYLRELGDIFAILFPEEFGSSAPATRITALPCTTARLEEMSDRFRQLAAILAPGDQQASDDVGYLADAAVRIDEDGKKHYTGKGAGGARCRDDAPVDRAYLPLCGSDRPSLPEPNDQQWRKWQVRRDSRDQTPSSVEPPVTCQERLGERVRYFRQQKRWTQGQLAKRARVTRSLLGHIELGKCMPNIAVVRKLAWALKLSIEELVGFHA